MSKKAVLKLEFHDDKSKKKAMKTVSGLSGVESISMDMKDQKLTVIGNIDPVVAVRKLRKLCFTEIISVGPAKEPEKKKEEPKKPEPAKKEEAKKPEPAKKEEAKKPDPAKKEHEVAAWANMTYYHPYYNPYTTNYYYVRSVEEDPYAYACVIL